jgi:hypothetical protein
MESAFIPRCIVRIGEAADDGALTGHIA